MARKLDHTPGVPVKRNLDHDYDPSIKARNARRRSRSPRRVPELGTTANLPPALQNPQWRDDLDYVWRMRTADELSRLQLRAKVQRRASRGAVDARERVRLSRSAEWHEHRAGALALPRAVLVGTCGKRFRRVACSCGTTDIPVGCDQVQLCPTCSKTHWRRWRRRITRSLDAHLTAAVREWQWRGRRGMRPGIYLITFTMPHSGDIGQDRRVMGTAWRMLTKVAHAQRWWSAFAMTWEVTPGTAGDGHVHCHVAVISSWVPYDALRAAWQHAIPGAIQPDVQAPGRNRSKPIQSAADYLAKYVTKGVDPGVFTGQKAGELMAAFRGLRKVSTSLGFWRPLRDRERRCSVCGARHVALGAPQGLQRVAAVRLYPRGWWDVGLRRHEQCELLDDS